jgi:hypothetical protein
MEKNCEKLKSLFEQLADLRGRLQSIMEKPKKEKIAAGSPLKEIIKELIAEMTPMLPVNFEGHFIMHDQAEIMNAVRAEIFASLKAPLREHVDEDDRSSWLERYESDKDFPLQISVEDLPRSIFQLKYLQSLDLYGNRLKDFPWVADLPDLRILNLSSNRLESVGRFQGFGNLEKFDCEENWLWEIPDLSSAVKLEKLNLSGSKGIQSIENLSGNTALRELELGNTGVLQIENLESLVNLEKLSLYETNIREVKNLDTLPNLIDVNISGCKALMQIPGMGDLPAVEKLFMQGVPYRKNDPKTMKKINKWIKKLGENFKFYP